MNKLGIDIGSTTIKLVIYDTDGNLIFNRYNRHFSDIMGELANLFEEAANACPDEKVICAITGSGGLNISTMLNLPFVQEVVAGATAANKYMKQADVAIELGGEDAKITYFKPTLEQRMNGTCAGGTGAFIDQMATLLNTDPTGLNALAKTHNTIYPIAARCGVFAKTDIQPLINEGAAKEDIAASIFQAVVNQTIAGLACGRPIRGNVAFLGGPLHYLDALKERFIKTLNLKEENIIENENSHLFVAMGAALMANGQEFSVKDLPSMLKNAGDGLHETRRLEPLFTSREEYDVFIERHSHTTVQKGDITAYEGECFLGIDAGSTTIKAILLDKDNKILFSHYSLNEASPLDSAVEILKTIYNQLNKKAHIAKSCVTGYGEAIIKEALKLDLGEIETMAHYRGARFFNKDVDFIIDIGGQDMKSLKIKNGVIDGIMLNEACSSGCGSFLSTFAQSLGISVEEFAKEAQKSRNPVDLGTRCTVFMNSKVKQAQKEGATVGDISSGLSYSVVKNALYKVIKVKDKTKLGNNIVVQGGTFKNDAILRAFEKELQREVIRPEIAELMGAFGAALYAKQAKDDKPSTVISQETAENFKYKGSFVRCAKCENKCMLTITTFEDGRRFISGNRCERGGDSKVKNTLPNLYEYKLSRLFSYKSKEGDKGKIGIPRALNIFENYPFWHTLFTDLGFEVVLSDPSNHGIFESGMETISSDTVCYPAKLIHGHIENLAKKGVKLIFYPCIPYEEKEYEGGNNHYNCPVVTSYPEVIKNNMGVLAKEKIEFLNPFFAMDEHKFMPKRIFEEFAKFGVTKEEAKSAVKLAYEEMKQFKRDIAKKGEETIKWLEETGNTGIVLAGRPYHVDAEINHGIPELITSFNFAVLTEDSVAHLGNLVRPVRVVDQWAFHTRLYEAAATVAKTDCLQLIQLNSFGCGLDAITTDQVQEIIEKSGKIYTLLKIDEISHLGAAKIRIRSLMAALKEKNFSYDKTASPVWKSKIFTKEMRIKGTVVCPQMAPMQFQFLKEAFDPTGYNFKVLTEVSKEDIDIGLKYVNNDACYPTIIVVGQLLNAFITGKLDPNNTTVMLTQTGGGCRATNYIAFLKKAFKEAGYPQVAIAPISFLGTEKHSGIKVSAGFGIRIMIAILMGDALQKVLLATRPYEKNKGECDNLYIKWSKNIRRIVKGTKYFEYRKAAKEMIDEFDNVERTGVKKPKVGIVGEILVKYHPDANNHAADIIEQEGGECVLPALMDFAMYGFYSSGFAYEKMGKSKLIYNGSKFGVKLVNDFKKPIQKALKNSKHFEPYPHISHLAQLASGMLATGNCTGEGWFLTAEMLHLIETDTPNIICVQPFACLPNHVVGKGMIRGIRDKYPNANITAIDYDPGASEVNQLNRIKLMLHTAFENMAKENS